jgi:hypothetical protein
MLDDLWEAVMHVLQLPLSADVHVGCGNWMIYRLEDGRISVSRFDDRGVNVEEELFEASNTMEAAERFCSIVQARALSGGDDPQAKPVPGTV